MQQLNPIFFSAALVLFAFIPSVYGREYLLHSNLFKGIFPARVRTH